MNVKLGIAAGAVAGVVLSTVVAATAQAEVSPHCQQHGYCLFSGAEFRGTKASVTSGNGCHSVSALGFPTARSVAQGFGDGETLELYADRACETSLGLALDEIPTTSAKSYRIRFIPS